MPKSRTISERKRAFLALQGTVLPRVGDRAVVQGAIDAEFSDDELVEVVRISTSGKTIWTLSLNENGQTRFGTRAQWAANHHWALASRGWYTCVSHHLRGCVLRFPQ